MVEVVSLSKSDSAKHTTDGKPLTIPAPTGGGGVRNIVPKNVEHEILECPECKVGLRYDKDEEAVCPECGMMTDHDPIEYENKDYYGASFDD